MPRKKITQAIMEAEAIMEGAKAGLAKAQRHPVETIKEGLGRYAKPDPDQLIADACAKVKECLAPVFADSVVARIEFAFQDIRLAHQMEIAERDRRIQELEQTHGKEKAK